MGWVLGLGPAQGTHGRTTHRSQHRVRVWGGWALYCTLGVGPGRDPLKLEPGEEAGGHHIPPPSGGGGETPNLGLEKKTGAAMCPALGRAKG